MMKIQKQDQEERGDHKKILYWSCLVCLLLFHIAGHVLASDLNKSLNVLAILKQVRTMVKSLKDNPEKYVLMGELGVVQAKTGQISDALQSLAQIPNSFQYKWQNNYKKNTLKKEIALAKARAGKMSEALQIAKSLPAHDPATLATFTDHQREDAIGGIAFEIAKAGDIPGALVLLEEIGEGTSAKEQALIAIGEFQVQKGNLRGGIQTALPAADRMAKALWGIVEDQVKTGHLKEVLKEIREIPLGIRQYAFWGIVRVQLEMTDLEGAIQMAERIADGDASAQAWQAIAYAQHEVGKIKESILSLQRARKGAIATHHKAMREVTLSQIAEYQAKAGDMAEAFKTTEMIEFEGSKCAALQGIAIQQSKAGDVDGAIRIASHFRGDLCSPHPYYYILQDLAKAGKIKQAMQIANSLDLESDRRLLPFEAIAIGQAEARNIEGALTTLTKIKRKGDLADYEKFKGLERISSIQIKNGDIEGATRTVSMIEQSWLSWANWTLQELFLALVKQGEMDWALALISGIQDDLSLANSASHIAHAQAIQGDPAGVLKWSQKITSPFVKSKVLLGLIRGVLDAKKT